MIMLYNVCCMQGEYNQGAVSRKKGDNMKTRLISLLFLICLYFNLVSSDIAVLGVISNANITVDPTTYVCTDGLGRDVSDYETSGDIKNDKFVGIFYWTWHSSHSKRATGNVTEILSKHPGIEHDYGSGWWGVTGSYFWDEPLFGYYDGLDKWVYRRHAELLGDAGVDVVIFDCTNGTDLFLDAADILMEAFAEARAAGAKTPQIAFMLPFWSEEAGAIDLRALYQNIYSVEKHKDLWFYWKGKPLVLGQSNGLLNTGSESDKKIYDFFTFRTVEASYYEKQSMEDQWGWLAAYPQPVFKNGGVKEQMSVGVAQNYSEERRLTAMNAGDDVHGRSWSVLKGGKDTRENSVLYGVNFAEQFEYAIKTNPEFIFITGWNEWVAGRQTSIEDNLGKVPNAFMDQFSAEYSRDIEPAAGEMKDHYYYQMVSYIRKFKGVSKLDPVPDKVTIDIHADSNQWENVGSLYKAYEGNTEPRNGKGYNRKKYQNNSGRNDIIGSKVTYDDQNVYFMVETANELTAYTDPAWMRLLIDVESINDGNNWETFEFVVNRVAPGDEGAVLERSVGGWNWETVGKVDFSVNGSMLQISIPRTELKITDAEFTLNFKWSDNCQEDGNIMDFYANGDVAPLGRFKYSFAAGFPEEKSNTTVVILTLGGIAVAALAVAAFVIIKRRKNKNESGSV